MDAHLTDGELRAVRAHTADPATLLRTMRHIASCASCAAKASEGIDVSQVARSLHEDIFESRQVPLAPAGTVVGTTRPHFVWAEQAGTAVVSVYDGDTLVARSRPLHQSEWVPDEPLARGRCYTWQVDFGDRVIPAPPDPPAVFAILEAAFDQS